MTKFCIFVQKSATTVSCRQRSRPAYTNSLLGSIMCCKLIWWKIKLWTLIVQTVECSGRFQCTFKILCWGCHIDVGTSKWQMTIFQWPYISINKKEKEKKKKTAMQWTLIMLVACRIVLFFTLVQDFMRSRKTEKMPYRTMYFHVQSHIDVLCVKLK